MLQKIRKKAAAFWRHGKHGHLMGVLCERNRRKAHKTTDMAETIGELMAHERKGH